MPSLSELVEKPELPTTVEEQPVKSLAQRVYDRLTGSNGVERYQLWPERLVRDAVTTPHDMMQPNPHPQGSEEAQQFENMRQAALPQAALNVASLAGTGGLAGTGTAAEGLTSQGLKEMTLGAGPFLRPALKYEGKIYKAPVNGQHLDALPDNLVNQFHQDAMSGEDISKYNFGFMNHKGQFLDREKALDYAIKEGLLHPNSEAARAGTLTSTMELQ